ncbi:MAG: hypothetical protein KAQ87_05475 [Candidatus Pacebacteria bacterium]|nr:hypothetical protein [Candidatus Paceibacterota bacterium]
MKNLKTKYLLIILVLLVIPFFKEVDAQLINIPTNEIINVPVVEINDNQPIDFLINKKEFTVGEKIEAKAVFHNQTQQPLAGRMIVTVSPLDKSFPAKPFLKEFNLLAGGKTEDFISEMKIEDWMPAGIYQAEIEIQDDWNHLVGKKLELFEVFKEEKINNEIEAAIQICSDKDCSKKRAVFNKNELVYFKLDTSLQDIQINATVKTPNGKIDVLDFENNSSSYSLENSAEGKYSLWVNLSKENYKSRRIEREFTFEKDYTEEIFESICKVDGKCENEENEQNCPQDCSSKITKISNLYIFVAVILIIVIGIIMFILKRKRSN